MKSIQRLALFAICLSALGGTLTKAQTTAQPQQEPKTRLQAFEAQTGMVIIKGFSTIGSVSSQNGGTVTVESRESLDASTGRRELGIVIDVKKVGDTEQKNSSYIDYDEIESLLSGIDYISKVQKSVTKLDDFEAVYHTVGDFKISTFSTLKNRTMVAVSSGELDEVRVLLPFPKLDDLRGLIAGAKEKLDAIK